MFKIVIDIRMDSSSGIGTYIKELVKLFSNYNNEHREDFVNTDLYSYKNFDLQSIRIESKIYSIKEQLLLPKSIPSCDIFWSPHYNVPVLPIAAKKLVVTIHDVYHLHNYCNLSLFQKLYVKMIMYIAVHRSDKIITVSEFSKNEILKYYKCDPTKISVIHNGVDQDRCLMDFDVVKSKYKLTQNYILFVGNVKPHKNLKLLIDAYLKLELSVRSNYKIVIVGKKDGFITGDQTIIDKIENDPVLKQSVLFTGFVDQEDIDTIYANASLFVFPSLYEGFGLPTLEAMKCLCPVIASDIPSNKEVCEDAALYFDTCNSSELADLMQKVLQNSNLRQKMIDKGIKQIKKFTWTESYNKHVKVFNDLLP